MSAEKEAIKQYLTHVRKQPRGFVYVDGTSRDNNHTTSSSEKSKIEQLEELYKPYQKCMQCPLATLGRTKVVFGEGNPDAKLLFVGEGPGQDEDKQGRPFVGRAGQLLTKIIDAMGLKREDVFITNVVKCRPPNNRAPLPEESTTCTGILLFKQIDIIQPAIICTLGSTATQALLGAQCRITTVRGTFCSYKNYPVLPTYHPAYLLRNPDAKRLVWDDMKKIMEKLNTSF